ncbi:MAG: hypothetical protein RMY64_04985 [Nostoc sp. DedQUE08]|uniref:hypothetical protein n=1 Tax=unclassified Nostoc TaxID=2593658 RepID=UPI002AD44223|nr:MULTISPECIES: hypothetical protein [unclassified Nostoc]MDZ8030043.1 hypothetical protein [Nostoc sp. DedSLP04]MDZ8064984.1 hypothetical protein [Nostoc sp. DedQUE08]
MLKIKHSQLNWLLAGMTLAVMGVSIAPASAQRAFVIDSGYGVRRSHSAERVFVNDGGYDYGVRRSPSVGSFIYGSPIPTPMLVDPTTGLIPQRNNYRDYSYPQFRQNVRNFTPINPTIRDSTLVNPVIINNSWPRTPFSGGRSRVIITYPR